MTPSALVEAYVISIAYTNGVPSMQLYKESRAGRKNIATSLLLSDAKLGIRNLINGIIVSAQDIPGELPRKSRGPHLFIVHQSLTAALANHIADMHLTYNNTCPNDYNPPGFRTCNDSNFIVNEKLTTRCDSLNTGHHGYVISNLESDIYLTILEFRSDSSVNVSERTNQQLRSRLALAYLTQLDLLRFLKYMAGKQMHQK